MPAEEDPVTPPQDKQRTKQLLMLLERALNVEERDRLMADAPSDAAALRKACEFVLELPRGAGLQGATFNLAWCTKRFNHISLKFLHPDKRRLDSHPSLLPRAADFDRAYQELNSTWQVLKPLLELSEGVYKEPAPRQPGEAQGASGATPQGAPPRRRRSQGNQQGATPHSPTTPPPPPPVPKTPVELFLAMDLGSEADDLMPYVVSITATARQRPKARGRRYVELDEKIRKDMALHLIDTSAPHLAELVSLGRVGEYGMACEIGRKQRKHHGQGGMEVFMHGNIDAAVQVRVARTYSVAVPPRCLAVPLICTLSLLLCE